jgi:DNA (cytosine-5)-methyltransferase 1
VAYTVIDLFSGGGGMSYGFHAHKNFEVVAAFDAQFGKPSSGAGSLQCNQTYEENIGVKPDDVNLADITESDLEMLVRKRLDGRNLDVMISCAPCTGFSRAKSNNHCVDDERNSLVRRSADFAVRLQPKVFLMENARELLKGNFTAHFLYLKKTLENAGYTLYYDIHFLSKFGLPQRRERAIVIAAKKGLKIRSLDDLWQGYSLRDSAITVRKAISHLPVISAGDRCEVDPWHCSPSMQEPSLNRLEKVPRDGGSWVDLLNVDGGYELLIPSMKRSVEKGKLGSHPDVYGRMRWDFPAMTIKRECAHIGNGRYAHPEQNRLCTVREMGILQGFPSDYRFVASNLSNMYRHIGDAVPPLISYQIAGVASWILSGKQPSLTECLLPKTSLAVADLIPDSNVEDQYRLKLA